jgi:glutamate dehydrogenase (NAD(P)+)
MTRTDFFPTTRDELGPEVVLYVHDPVSGMRGVLVIDNSVLGPTGGGARMAPDITGEEIARLARSMTYKFGIFGFPRGGCKSGICADASAPVEARRAITRAFGHAVRPFLVENHAAIGPDMGVTVRDVDDVYDGAGVTRLRSGLFAREIDGDPTAYHLTGHGVIGAAKAVSSLAGLSMRDARVAVEGFGQVGTGCARRVQREGAKLVAISTILGAIYDERGLDVSRLLELRRRHGDRCVLEYTGAAQIDRSEIYYLPVDVLVPGARPDVITEENASRIQARLISSGGNIAVTESAQEILFQRGVVVVPDFISNAGAAIASWVDFMAGEPDQAFAAIDRLITSLSSDVISESQRTGQNPYRVATARVKARIAASRLGPRKSFDQTKSEIRDLLGVF